MNLIIPSDVALQIFINQHESHPAELRLAEVVNSRIVRGMLGSGRGFEFRVDVEADRIGMLRMLKDAGYTTTQQRDGSIFVEWTKPKPKRKTK